MSDRTNEGQERFSIDDIIADLEGAFAALGHGISITSAPGQGTLVRLDFNQNNTVFD